MLRYFHSVVCLPVAESGEIPDVEPTGLTVGAEECETSASCGEAITAEGMLSYASENCCDDGECVLRWFHLMLMLIMVTF